MDHLVKLLADLRDPDPKVRRAAAEALPEAAAYVALDARFARRTPEQVEALRGHLKAVAPIIRDKGEDPRVRQNLIRALGDGQFGSIAEVATPALLDVLRDEADDEDAREKPGSVSMMPCIIQGDENVGPAPA